MLQGEKRVHSIRAFYAKHKNPLLAASRRLATLEGDVRHLKDRLKERPMVEHSENVRLIPLDIWERDWIRGALQHALGIQALARADAEQEFRLRELMKKIHPKYARVDEDGRVVELVRD